MIEAPEALDFDLGELISELPLCGTFVGTCMTLHLHLFHLDHG